MDPIFCSVVSGMEHVEGQTRTECRRPSYKCCVYKACLYASLTWCEEFCVTGTSYHRFGPLKFGNIRIQLYAIRMNE